LKFEIFIVFLINKISDLYNEKQPLNIDQYAKSNLQAVRKRLYEYTHSKYLIFKRLTKSVLSQAATYADLLIVTERGSRNIEEMTNNLSPKEYHRIQHFISESKWSARDLMVSVAQDVNELFKNEKHVGLLIDESSEEKKGEHSVGVSHQYCGNLGKPANCQVAVFATLSAGEHFSIVDAELYLPKVWTDDTERCKKAGIPKETVYKKKTEIALDIIKRLKLAGIRFDYVSADGLYGHDMDFRSGLDELGVLFVADVHKDLRIFQEPFEIEVPQKREGAKGKTPTKARPNKMDERVDKYISNLKSDDWKKVIIRNGSKGTLVSHVHAKEIYVEEGGKCVKRTLIIRKTKEHKREKISYSLSNGSLEKYSLEVLVGYQAQRYYIEQSFREAKQNIGMCDYQVRGWLAWNHHIALSMMALAFLSMEKMAHQEQLPLLSYRDIRDAIIENFIQEEKRKNFEEKLLERHLRRQKDINRYYKKT
jgi:SRSO17 transposase